MEKELSTKPRIQQIWESSPKKGYGTASVATFSHSDRVKADVGLMRRYTISHSNREAIEPEGGRSSCPRRFGAVPMEVTAPNLRAYFVDHARS